MSLPISIDQLKSKLIQENLISPEKFDALVTEAERKNENFIDKLISERIIERNFINQFIASTLGVGVADLAVTGVDETVVKMLPEEIARQRKAVAFRREEDGTFDVAMVDPNDLETIGFLSERLAGKIKPYLATAEDLDRVFSIYGMEMTRDFKKIIEENVQASLRTAARNLQEASIQVPVVAIVDNLITYASSLRASDIHLEILEESTLIRYRIDGILYEVLRIPKEVHSALVARIKILGGLKIDEHHQPQDGRFRYRVSNQFIDVRVSVIPTFYGEKMEMRLLESAQKPLSFEELGMLEPTAKVVADNLKKAYGMIVSCGPTGSGKTTTLYAIMNVLNKPTVNINTIEDPIEYNIKYVNQTQINTAAGITFATGLRALLRQDPNIIMVGEIRDSETANISVQAALTGHLIVTSLHTNDAPTAIPRLFDLGVPPFLAAATLNLVLAQRLVRKVCQECIYSYEIPPEVKELVVKQLKELGINDDSSIPKIIYKGKGCNSCNMLGYRGRLGIFEALEIDDKMKKLIIEPQLNLEGIRKELKAIGFKTMFEDGLYKVQLGKTTIEEVLRVIRE
ncbi:MAG: type II/IV secretion system protein [Candidatus Liptonbacteria bacterium]|nr:type II/IV secretion system protein [Candidatus Liptonbacteria bacterium]